MAQLGSAYAPLVLPWLPLPVVLLPPAGRTASECMMIPAQALQALAKGGSMHLAATAAGARVSVFAATPRPVLLQQ